MPNYTCPACDGGFPEPKFTTEDVDDGVRVDESCPWCGESLEGFPRVVESRAEAERPDIYAVGESEPV